MLTEKPNRLQSGASRRHSQCSVPETKPGKITFKTQRSLSQSSTTSALTRHILAREEQQLRRSSYGQAGRSRQQTPLSSAIRNFQRSASSGKKVVLDLEDNEDLETILDLTEKREEWDSTGQRAYERACQKFGAVPAQKFLKGLANATEINLSNYGVGPRGTMAAAVPLVINSKCTNLNLMGNAIDEEGIMYIAEILEENTTITDLNLSNNNLRTFGAKRLGEMLSTSRHLTDLDISGNNFSDKDAQTIIRSLEFNTSLRSLSLAHNNFGAGAGEIFQHFISENQHLEELDLSWNHIRGPGAVKIASAIKDNHCLRTLNLAWNGFQDEGAIVMASSLGTNTNLTDLDLSCNRVHLQGFLALCKAFSENQTLKILRLCHNPIPDEAAEAGIDFLRTVPSLSLRFLDLRNVFLKTTFEDKIKSVRQVHTKFNCRFGYSDTYGKRRLSQHTALDDAFRYLNTYVTEHGIQLIDLFARFDVNGSMSVTNEEFKEGLKDARIPLSSTQVEQLIQYLDKDGDGEIDFSELVLGSEEFEQQHRTTQQLMDKLTTVEETSQTS